MIQANHDDSSSMATIEWNVFMKTKVKLCVCCIIQAEPFPEARKPAYKLLVDFGPEVLDRGNRARSSPALYARFLGGKLVVAVAISAQTDRADHVRVAGHGLP
ncbi:hypothetical protein SB783_38745 [Paraburkholderia sp. SIMBA_009]|uniref:hypothetical protein n=1 Tax=Burkholderia gladioli TaxID=28095 RepID=UPI003A0332C3